MLQAVLISLAVGSLLLIPSLALLFILFQREHRHELEAAAGSDGLAGISARQNSTDPRRKGAPSQ
jgi:hypothetical protein